MVFVTLDLDNFLLYLFLSRSLSPLSSQTKAQEISHRMNGNVPSKQANTYSTIEELKAYFAEPKKGEEELARSKIVNALQVKGAAAWIVHNAVKRNKDKHRKGRYLAEVLGLLPGWITHVQRCGTLQEMSELIGSMQGVLIARHHIQLELL